MGNRGSVEGSNDFEITAEIEEEAKNVAASIRSQLGNGKPICILGGDCGGSMPQDIVDLVRIMAKDLPTIVGQRAVFLTNDEEGVQHLFTQHCSDESSLWSLIPEGTTASTGHARTVFAGQSEEVCKATLVCAGDLFITVHGERHVAKQAKHALELGAAVLPVIRTGGASSGEFDFPQAALQRPSWVDEEVWRLLSEQDGDMVQTAAAVAQAVNSWLASHPQADSEEARRSAAGTLVDLDSPIEVSPATASPEVKTTPKAESSPASVVVEEVPVEICFGPRILDDAADEKAARVTPTSEEKNSGKLNLQFIANKLQLSYQELLSHQAPSAIKKKGAAALLKGLKSGEVSKLVDKMEAMAAEEVAEPEVPQKEAKATEEVAEPEVQQKAPSAIKKKGAAALLKGLKSGEVSKLVDKMEAKAAEEVAEPKSPQKEAKVEEVAESKPPQEEAKVEEVAESKPPQKEVSDAAPPVVVPPAVPFEWNVELEVAPAPDKTAETVSVAVVGDAGKEADASVDDELADFQGALPEATASPTEPLRLPIASANASPTDSNATPSLFKLAPPPPPSSSVGSPAVNKKVIPIEELVDVATPVAAAPASPPKAAPMEANLAAVAAALSVGPPAKLAVTPNVPVKEFLHREPSTGQDPDASDEEVAGIARAAAVDADVDDEACETLLGGEQTLAYSGNIELGKHVVPLGRIAPADGLDSASDDEAEEVKPLAKGGTAPPAPKRPESHSTPESLSAQQPAFPPPSRPRVVATGSGLSPPAAMAPPVSMELSMTEVDQHLTRTLDRFFNDEKLWQQVAAEVASCPKLRHSMEWLQAIVPQVRSEFRVQVPEPYPGIQYRRSKVMGDRYTRYAKHGTIVKGHIEASDDKDDGEWLKVADNVYLPMKVGELTILRPVQGLSGELTGSLPDKNGQDRIGSRGKVDSSSRWCSGCGPPGGETGGQHAGVVRETPQNDVGEVVVPDDAVLDMPQAAVAATSLRSGQAAVAATSLRSGQDTSKGGFTAVLDQSNAGTAAARAETRQQDSNVKDRAVSHLDEASRLLSGSEPINPFTDTPRGGSPNNSPLRSRLLSDPMAPINPFSDTPPGSPKVTALRARPASVIG